MLVFDRGLGGDGWAGFATLESLADDGDPLGGEPDPGGDERAGGRAGGAPRLQYPPGILVLDALPFLAGRAADRLLPAGGWRAGSSSPPWAGCRAGVPLGGDDRAGPQRRPRSWGCSGSAGRCAGWAPEGSPPRRRARLLRRPADLLLPGGDEPRPGLRPGRAAAPGAGPAAGGRGPVPGPGGGRDRRRRRCSCATARSPWRRRPCWRSGPATAEARLAAGLVLVLALVSASGGVAFGSWRPSYGGTWAISAASPWNVLFSPVHGLFLFHPALLLARGGVRDAIARRSPGGDGRRRLVPGRRRALWLVVGVEQPRRLWPAVPDRRPAGAGIGFAAFLEGGGGRPAKARGCRAALLGYSSSSPPWAGSSPPPRAPLAAAAGESTRRCSGIPGTGRVGNALRRASLPARAVAGRRRAVDFAHVRPPSTNGSTSPACSRAAARRPTRSISTGCASTASRQAAPQPGPRRPDRGGDRRVDPRADRQGAARQAGLQGGGPHPLRGPEPAPPRGRPLPAAAAPPPAVREKGAGRPTKKERRDIDRWEEGEERG